MNAPTILLVEDNDDIREAVAEFLNGSGYQVCEAENGQVALDRLQAMQERPSLMLLDLMMPVMGGVELLHRVKQEKRLARMPVIVVSASGESAQIPQANKFMGKPMDYDLLLRCVDELCGRTAACDFRQHAREPA
ncbi:MAG: response regulator [Myxococcaceae bacterium]|nr:response regulator [Myxococcaceae bacterium]